MFTDSILRPLGNIYIPNLPFVPRCLGDVMLSPGSGVYDPALRGGVQVSAENSGHLPQPQAEGF